ncbi:histamine H2 receptor-like [Glandiceps talaboti]
MDNVTDTTNPGGFNNSRSGVDILFGVIGIIGVIGNLTVCVVFLRTRSLRTLTNYLIVHQAAIDFATCIFITIDFIMPKYSFTSDSMFGEMICRLWKSGYFKWSLFLASSLNLVVITMERYCAIIHPLHHYRLFSTTRVKIMLALVWITALSVKSFNIIVQYFDHGHCTVGKVWPSKEVAQIVSVSNCIVQYFVPLVVMAVAYTRCVLVLRKDPLADAKVSTSAQTNTAKDKSLKMASRNVLKMLVLVFLAYAICWGPNQVMFMLYCVGVNVNIFKTYFQVFIVLGYINTAINPFIYALKYKQFQRGIKLVFCPRSLSLVGDTSNLPTVDRLRSDNRRNPTVTTE